MQVAALGLARTLSAINPSLVPTDLLKGGGYMQGGGQQHVRCRAFYSSHHVLVHVWHGVSTAAMA